MIDIKKELYDALVEATDLPVYYDFAYTRNSVPAITYREINNSDKIIGDTMVYSDIYVEIKIFTKQLSELVSESIAINKEMREMGYTRYFAEETNDDINYIKILRYVAIGYNNEVD